MHLTVKEWNCFRQRRTQQRLIYKLTFVLAPSLFVTNEFILLKWMACRGITDWHVLGPRVRLPSLVLFLLFFYPHLPQLSYLHLFSGSVLDSHSLPTQQRRCSVCLCAPARESQDTGRWCRCPPFKWGPTAVKSAASTTLKPLADWPHIELQWKWRELVCLEVRGEGEDVVDRQMG